ncbi:hydroxyacid dehydrogenase [Ornithobacterium rhinotracheale]|uniref:2-hydroxyacid dehydrogenase n=1 Tax=Ornithobacterium rhinotracheale TaxID=28251 RepID=UPI00129C2B18|nr:2-hydroxyacid dehydrogenase [Ornithobacterium rhinotracheale]MRJ07764.1 hydroxyacid dehydrogenase [Ornithobacterium rhinotracheale]UOH78715.1 2-hydroxyacid dehydrogenase [Ornithobacterium rhinotracheale]
MKVLALDTNHPILIEKLKKAGFSVDEDYTSTKNEVEQKIADYDGMIIRSRFPIDETFLSKAKNLKFIGRVGAGLENIDLEFAESRGIVCFNAPEGNRDAVAEQAMGMLLSIMNRFWIANREVSQGIWKREENRGEEIKGKVVALIGYGNMGKAFAQRLKGFGCEVIFYDIKDGLSDENARQTSMDEVFERADILSLHIPQTPETLGLVNDAYLQKFHKNIYFINTARGKSVVTKDLVKHLKTGKVKAAALDVLEQEKASFESLLQSEIPEELNYLIQAENVLLTPHIAGWTLESKVKLAEVIADKIIEAFG